MKLRSLVLCASLVSVSSACATIMSPGPDSVPVSSYPAGARVYLDDQLVGKTPVVVQLDRDHSDGRIRVEVEGYRPAILRRSKGIEGWFWMNLLCTGPFGMIIDLATGSARGFDDTPIMVSLIPAEGVYPPGP